MPQMNGKYLFDTIMDCVDSNIGEGEITSSRKSALRAIVKATTYSIKEIKSYFMLTTGNTLDWYFRQRRLFHAFGEMKKSPEKPISAIANFYGYADSASFNHAFKQAFSVSPTKARADPGLVKDNRLVYGDFQQAEPIKPVSDDMRGEEIMHMIEFNDYEEYGQEEYGFNPVLCREIVALADKLGVPVYRFMDSCFDLVVDVQSAPDYLPPEVETAIDWGISSADELEQICRYYDCHYFELNSFMVSYYRQNAGKFDEE